ncbi:MAG TPA: DUF3606 domain-containing protein [Caulobacteraceae bacterium]|nr:DUF3606 domain-containing protein [Caulobacteraceae bacterium]
MTARERRSFKPRDTIDLTRSSDVRYWTRRLGVTPEELRVVVEQVGDCAAAVATEFGVPLTAA